MKKIVTVLLVGMFCLGLCGCNQTQEVDEQINYQAEMRNHIFIEPAKFVDVEINGLKSTQLYGSVFIKDVNELSIDRFGYTLIENGVDFERYFKARSEYLVFDAIEGNQAITEFPYKKSIHMNQWYNIEAFYRTKGSIYTTRSRLVRLHASASIPTHASVGDEILLAQTDPGYVIYESAWHWVDRNPLYNATYIPGGKYLVDKEYNYKGRRYIHLEGKGWLLVPTEEEKTLHFASFNRYESEVDFNNRKFNYNITEEYSHLYDYTKYYIEVFYSSEAFIYNEDDLVATTSHQTAEFKAEGGLSKYTPHGYTAALSWNECDGKYINAILYMDYYYKGEFYEKVKTDEISYEVR